MPAKSSGCKFLRGSLQTSEWPRAEQRVPGQSRGAGEDMRPHRHGRGLRCSLPSGKCGTSVKYLVSLL